ELSGGRRLGADHEPAHDPRALRRVPAGLHLRDADLGLHRTHSPRALRFGSSRGSRSSFSTASAERALHLNKVRGSRSCFSCSRLFKTESLRVASASWARDSPSASP